MVNVLDYFIVTVFWQLVCIWWSLFCDVLSRVLTSFENNVDQIKKKMTTL